MNLSADAWACLRSVLAPDALVAIQHATVPPLPLIAEQSAQLRAQLRAIQPFIPQPVLHAQLRQPQVGRVVGAYWNGSVLFADLSGFTKLNAELAATGRQGVETVHAIVTQLYAMLAQQVLQHGGLLLKFGGDALTAFFDQSDLGPRHAAQASGAALAMHQGMAELSAQLAISPPLQLRIGVQSGRIFAAEVGDAQHMELVITGRAINRVALAQEIAAPGEVVICNATRDSLGQAVTEARQSGFVLLRRFADDGLMRALPPIVPVPEAPPSLAALLALAERICALRPYLPYNLPQRFLLGHHPSIGEFRPVSVLFVNFYSFSALLPLLGEDVSMAVAALNAYYRRAQAVVHAFGGSVNKVDMSLFGDKLLALFGAPTANDDDPRRAVQAAWELRAALAEANAELMDLIEARDDNGSLLAATRAVDIRLRQRMGVTSGVVFAGLVGDERRREYTVMGQTVNLAARLMAAAQDDTILLSSLVARSVEGHAVLHAAEPITIRGVEQPLPVAVLARLHHGAQPTSAAGERSAFVGRAAELDRIVAAAYHAANGNGRVVALGGEAGIGKTRLVAEALRRIVAAAQSDTQLRVVAVTGRNDGQDSGYNLLGELMRQVLGLQPDADQAALLGQLKQYAPRQARFAPLLAALLNMPMEPTPATSALTAEQRRAQTWELVVALVLASARQRPLLIWIDDLHLVDAASRACLARVAQAAATAPLLLLLSYRREAQLAEPWAQLAHAERIVVRELPRTASTALLEALLDVELPPALLELLDWTRGVPFFLVEVVRYLRESGALAMAPDGARLLLNADPRSLPSSIERVITARLDRLDEQTRYVAQVAAVIGVRFDQGLLAAIVDAPSGFAAQLAELRDAGLIVPDPDKASSYLFAHAITRDVVYAGILYAQRRVLHLHVATHIAARATAAPASQAALLGHHYRLAEAWAQALPHLWLAAQQAHQRHANDEALALYRDACAALEQLAEPPIEALHGIYTELGDVLTLVGDYDAARVSYERLLQQLPQDANSSCERAQLHCKIGAGYTQQGQPKEALLWLERGYALLDDETGERCLLERARLCSEIGWAHFTQMRYNVARSWLEQALALLQLTSAHDESARLYNRLGGLAWSQGSLEEAQIYVEYSLQLCEQNGDIAGQALALNNLGLLADTRGDWDAATRWYSLAFQRNEMLGDRRGQAVVAHNLGVLKAYQQLYHQALVYLHDAVRLSEAVGDLFHLMRSRRELGRVLLNWGRYEAARPYLEQALEQAVALELPLEQLDSHAALGVLALECGKLEQAREQAAVGAPLLHAHNNDSSETGRFGRFLALLAWHEGDDARAAALLGEAAALFERIADRPEALVTYRLLAQLNSGPFVADEC